MKSKKKVAKPERSQANFRLSPGIRAKLQQIADDNGWTLTQAIAHIIRTHKL